MLALPALIVEPPIVWQVIDGVSAFREKGVQRRGTKLAEDLRHSARGVEVRFEPFEDA